MWLFLGFTSCQKHLLNPRSYTSQQRTHKKKTNQSRMHVLRIHEHPGAGSYHPGVSWLGAALPLSPAHWELTCSVAGVPAGPAALTGPAMLSACPSALTFPLLAGQPLGLAGSSRRQVLPGLPAFGRPGFSGSAARWLCSTFRKGIGLLLPQNNETKTLISLLNSSSAFYCFQMNHEETFYFNSLLRNPVQPTPCTCPV